MTTERILITGGTGFIGSNLIPKLLEAKHEVVGVERYSAGRYNRLDNPIPIKTLDLTDHERVALVLKEINPTVVVHLAALSSVGYSYCSSTEVFRVNALATINLIERCREVLPNLKHFVFASTTEIYGVTNDRPVTEKTVAMPNSPYSVAKFAADRYAQYVWMAYQWPVTIMRSSNSYGRVNDTNFLVEKTIMNMLTSKVVRLGDPSPIRDMVYIDDHVNAYMAVINNRDKSLGEIFNISTHESYKVVEIVHMIKRLTGFTGTIQWGNDKRPLDIQDHRIDSTKIRDILGWAPKYSLEEGLTLTIEKLRAKLQTTEAFPSTTVTQPPV